MSDKFHAHRTNRPPAALCQYAKDSVLVELVQRLRRRQVAVLQPFADAWMGCPAAKVNFIPADVSELVGEYVEHLLR